MRSKVVGMLLVCSILLAAVNAVDFDFTEEDLDDFMNLIEEGGKASGKHIVKRGGGRRIIRCVHHANGASCVCDRRYKRNYQKYYLLCVGQGSGIF